MSYINVVNKKGVNNAISGYDRIIYTNSTIPSSNQPSFTYKGYNGYLDENIVFKICFTNGYSPTTDTSITLNNIPIKIYKNGSLVSLSNYKIDGNYICLDSGTILDLYYDSVIGAFIIIGNPKVLHIENTLNSVGVGYYSDCDIYADGTKEYEEVVANDTSDITIINHEVHIGIYSYDDLYDGKKISMILPQINDISEILSVKIDWYNRLNDVNPISNKIYSYRFNNEMVVLKSHHVLSGPLFGHILCQNNTSLELVYNLNSYSNNSGSEWIGWVISPNTCIDSNSRHTGGYNNNLLLKQYKVYANGLVKQWGVFQPTSSGNSDEDLTFIVAYDDVNYTFTTADSARSNNDNYSGGANCESAVNTKYSTDSNKQGQYINLSLTGSLVQWNAIGWI